MLVLAVVAALGVTAACSEPELDCSRPTDRPVGGVRNVAVLLDVTGSTRSTGVAPDYVAAVESLLKDAVDDGEVVSVGTFDGSASTVEWTVDSFPTATTANQPSNQRKQQATATACLSRFVRQAATAPARTSGTDLLGALGVAAAHTATGGQARRTVVLATDGLSTTGCADLSRTPAGRMTFIDTAATECPQRRDWPAALANTHLTMIGVGRPANGQPILETGHLAWLRQYWERLCLVAGAASCNISTAPVPTRSAGSAAPAGAEAPDDPVVHFKPGAGPPAEPVQTVTFNIPSAALFATDSDEIGPAGRNRLAEIAEENKLPKATHLEVVGHTDSRDDADYNQDLSERRAAAVGRILRELGVPVSKTRGRGEEVRLCLAERLPGGGWDDACLQRNRRVEIVISKQSG
ncbi:OmpA/MotB domain protein [Micromonospora maris AB-18-032]|nr:OmpA/MotB domain protein [Micromonospora maris AB-18-032]